MKKITFFLFLIPFGLLAQNTAQVPNNLLQFQPYIGDWHTIPNPEMLEQFPETKDMVGFRFEWADPNKKTLRYYEGLPNGDVKKQILGCLVTENPRTGDIEFLGYQSRNDFLFKGTFEFAEHERGKTLVRLYDVYYPHHTKFRNAEDSIRGMISYRDICYLIGQNQDTLECTVERLQNGLWKPWGDGKPFQMERKKTALEYQKVYDQIAWLIGEWESSFGERSAKMRFSWDENQRMINYVSAFKPRKEAPEVLEAKGIITYHGIRDKVIFINTYLRKTTHLISEGHYEFDKDGTIRRLFTCHYKGGDKLPWSDGAVAPKGGKSIEFKQVWTPIDENSFEGEFFWKKDDIWERPIKEFDENNKELWKRKK